MGMVELWVLHIALLRRTFDQSLLKIFQRLKEIRNGHESVMDGQIYGWTNGQTDR